MNLSYIANNLDKLVSVQLGSRSISFSNFELSIEDASFILAKHSSGEVTLITLDKITEFYFDSEKATK